MKTRGRDGKLTAPADAAVDAHAALIYGLGMHVMRVRAYLIALGAFGASGALACDAGQKAPPPAVAPQPMLAKPPPSAPTDAARPDAAARARAGSGAANKTPDFGCFAYSPERDYVACIIGAEGVNIGTPLQIDLVLSHLSKDSTTTIHLISSDDNLHAPDELPPDAAFALPNAVRNFTPLSPDEHVVGGPFVYDHAWTGSLRIGGGEIVATIKPGPRPSEGARHYHIAITGFGSAIDEHDETLSSFTLHAFALGDAVIVDEVYSVGDEGVYGSYGNAYRCTKLGCAKIQ